jgi:molybdopterin molybdotransferase
VNNISIGLKDALLLTLENIKPLPAVNVAVADSVDCSAASDLYALVDSPSADSSLKDGYAVLSSEVSEANPERPVRLSLAGYLAAGGEDKEIELKPGTTIRIMTGARIPAGADAVVAEEFVKQDGGDVLVTTFAEPGRNILRQGTDVSLGKCVIRRGMRISPGMAGLIAAAGHGTVQVFKRPSVAVIGTGDEIVAPGGPLLEGKLYASNAVTLAAWCHRYGMATRIMVVKDDREAIINIIKEMLSETDAIVTSGGAWTSDRDMMASVLDELGWRMIFHRIRIGPGKAVGFGLLNNKPVFILPGGPSSNLMGFLQIALPGLLALSGHTGPGLPRINARLASALRGRETDWTHFFLGRLQQAEGIPLFHPLGYRSRLQSMAEATAVAEIAEGMGCLQEGMVIPVQLLEWT